MKADETKAVSRVARELSKSHTDLAEALKETKRGVSGVKKLWRSKNNSILVKAGLALIAFPDPTISDVVGLALVAAGTVQTGIRHRTLYVEDVYKTFQSTFKDIRNLKQET